MEIKSETKNWPHEIIDFLYKCYSESWTELNRFLYDKLNLEKDNTTHKDKIKELLDALENDKRLTWKVLGGYYKDKQNITGWVTTDENYKKQFHELPNLTLESGRIEARLTLNGLDYAIQLERERQQHDSILTTNNSVRGTNTKTWVIAGVAALFAMLTFFKDCGRDSRQVRKLQQLQDTLIKQLQDSSRQIRETLQSDVHRIEDSLKKISDEITNLDTPKTPMKPKPTDKP